MFYIAYPTSTPLRSVSNLMKKMKQLSQLIFIALLTFIFACRGEKSETEDNSKDIPQKEGARLLSETELTFAKKWQVTEFTVPGATHEYKNKDYFIDLQKDGSFSCKFVLNEEENETKGTGKWKLQYPKPKEWDGKVENWTEPYKIADKEEILILAFDSAKTDQVNKYTIMIAENKLYLSIPWWYYSIMAVAK